MLLAFALGIFWADRRASDRLGFDRSVDPSALHESTGTAALAEGLGLADGLVGVALALAVRLGRRGRGERSGGRGRRRRGPLVCGRLLVVGIAFLAGAERLDRALESAAHDRSLVEATRDAASPRRLEARVESRRSTAWGLEIVLGDVRAADAAGPVPRRLLLSLQREEAEDRGSASIPAPGESRADDSPRGSRAEQLLWPGAVARLAVRIRPLEGRRNPGTEDRARRWARQGIAARARLVDPDWVLAVEPRAPSILQHMRGLHAALERARVSGVDRVARRFESEGRSAGLARALAVGDRRGLSESVRDAFRTLGLSHLIAVSGLHVGLVAGLASLLFAGGVDRLAGGLRLGVYGRFSWAILAGAVSGAAYAWLAGAPPSAVRALALLALFSVARVARRDVDPARALGLAAFGMLGWTPSALFELGPQLSFAACAALVAGGVWQSATPADPPRESPHAGAAGGLVLRWAREACFTSLAVSLGTAPFVLAAGIPLAVIAPVVNLVAIPWTGLVVLPCSLAAAIGAELLPDALLRWFLWPARLSEVAAVAMAEAWPRATPLDAMPLWVSGLGAAAGILALRSGARWLAGLAWVALAVAGSPPLRHGPAPPSPPRVVFFDVGQGDAALVEGERGAMLIDAGGGAVSRSVETISPGSSGAALVRALRALGVTRLDVLVVTHGDLDHRGGAPGVLSRLEVDALWLPDGAQDDARLRNLARHAHEQGVAVVWHGAAARSGVGGEGAATPPPPPPPPPTAIEVGDLTVEVLWPSSADPGRASSGRNASTARREKASRNDESLVLRIGVGGRRVLFAADVGATVEARLLEQPDRVAAEILKLGHHGSRKSTSRGFLEAVSPAVVVLSAPCDATRGLPSRDVLERIDRAGVRLAWTGRDGAVSWGTRGARATWSAWAPQRRCSGSPGSPSQGWLR